MRKKWILHRLFITLGVFLLAAPVLMALGSGVSPAAPTAWLPPLAAALLLALLVRMLPKKLRVPGVILTAAAFAALMLFWSLRLGAALPGAILTAGLASAVLALHVLILSQPWGQELPASIVYVGVAEYLVIRVVCAVVILPQMAAPLRLGMLAFLCYIIIFLVLHSLRDGMGGDRAPSRRMTLRNGGAALGLIAVLLVLTHLRQLKDALARALYALRDGLFWLLAHIPMPGDGGMGQGSGDGMSLGLMAGEETGPSAFAQFMEKAAYVVGGILLAIALFYFLRMLGRLLLRGLRRLIARLRAYGDAVTDAYEDTVESLLDWGEVKRAYQERRKKARAGREKQTPWEKLPPRQQVRRSYQEFLRRHPEVLPQQTARQALSCPHPADIYEKARYSSRGVSPEEAREMRRLTDQSDGAARRGAQ